MSKATTGADVLRQLTAAIEDQNRHLRTIATNLTWIALPVILGTLGVGVLAFFAVVMAAGS